MYTKQEVSFEHPAQGPHRCSECAHYRGADKCQIVEGVVRPQDWCKKFTPKKRAKKK